MYVRMSWKEAEKKFNAHEDLAKLEASYRYYKVVEIEEREV